VNQEQAIEQAKGLNERWPDITWCVIRRGTNFVPKMLSSTMNGQRVGIDYLESDIVWKSEGKAVQS
jgi:hypothetical protein